MGWVYLIRLKFGNNGKLRGETERLRRREVELNKSFMIRNVIDMLDIEFVRIESNEFFINFFEWVK